MTIIAAQHVPVHPSLLGARSGLLGQNRLPMATESVGDRLRRARRSKGWSQEKLAEASGVNRSYIGDLEANSDRRPSEPDNLRALATALEVPLRFLAEPLGWYTEEAPPPDDWKSAIKADKRLDDSTAEALIKIIEVAVERRQS